MNAKREANELHDVKSFFSQADNHIAAEYRRIHAATTQDPGTAGDQGEQVWENLIRDWLPESYHVTTKGRLISADGRKSPQLDVVVLKPGYPRMLRDKKMYLADGVAAVFECKNTLKRDGLVGAIKKCGETKTLFNPRTGSPFRELFSPIICGVLAHSHNWKGSSSKTTDLLTGICTDAERTIEDPRHLLDFLCVADLGSWERMATVSKLVDSPVLSVSTSFMCASIKLNEELPAFSSVGAFISAITRRLAASDEQFSDFAEYYRRLELVSRMHGMPRDWPIGVLSDEVRNKYRSSATIGRGEEREWSPILFF